MGTRRPITFLAMAASLASFCIPSGYPTSRNEIYLPPVDDNEDDEEGHFKKSLSEDAAIQHEKLQRAEAKRYRKRMKRVRCAGMA